MYPVFYPQIVPRPCVKSSDEVSVSDAMAKELMELKCETKFNVLLLLRNRYPEGLETKLMRKHYNRFFGKEINASIFNPDARNPLRDNRDFFGEEITVFARDHKIYFKVKRGCSDETMEFLSNSVYANKKSLENKYLPNPGVHIQYFGDDDMNGSYLAEVPTADSFFNEVEEADPLSIENANSNGSRNNAAGYALVENTEYPTSRIVSSNIAKSTSLSSQNYVVALKRVPKVKPPKVYLCLKGCKREFDNEIKQKRHSKSCLHKQLVRKCLFIGCSKSFVDESLLKQHMELYHNRDNDDVSYTCPWEGCGKTFRSKESIRRHINVYHNVKTFQCSVPKCSRVFPNLEKLNIHETRCRFKYETFAQMELEDQKNDKKDHDADHLESEEATLMCSSEYVDLNSVKTEEIFIYD